MASSGRPPITSPIVKLALAVALLSTALPTAGASGLLESVRRSLISCRISAHCGVTCEPPSEKCDGPGHGPSQPSQPAWPSQPSQPSWPSQPSVPPPSQPAVPPTQSCFGNLPFGLENCICDGAQIGEAAGMAACSRVATQCEHFVAFSNLEAVSRICDSFALDACTAAARLALEKNPTCLRHFDQGGSSCSGSQAKKTFDDAVKEFCKPLCPDCPRNEEKDYPGPRPEVPQVPPSRPPPTGGSKPKCTDSLEFQLEQCVCDGDITGVQVAKSACDKVKFDCIPDSVLTAFNAQPTLEEVQQVCDGLTRDACLDKATENMDEECWKMVTMGGQKCTAGQALQKFLEATEYGCQAVDCAGCGVPASQTLPF